ncbi:MAG: transcriptional repressor LexA [Gammaproteobacteria bacterium]
MKSLTARQQAILEFVTARIAADGLPPTLAEIAAAFGFSQPHAAQKHLAALAAKGHLELLPGKARGIRLPSPSGAGRVEGVWLPIYGRVAAGVPIGVATADEIPQVLVDRALFTLTPHYLLKVQGDSMRDEGILDGDLIAVQRAPDAGNGRIVVARIDDEITVKRLQRTAERILLLPGNPAYAPIEVPPTAHFAIEGLFCGLVRRA